MVSKQELRDYLNGLLPEVRKELLKALVQLGEELKRAVLRRVFKALDLNKDGKVDKSEILQWLKTESSWRTATALVSERTHLSFEQIRERVYRDIDHYRDGIITFEELEAFFSSWSLREVRRFTEDQLFYEDLRNISSQTRLSRVAEEEEKKAESPVHAQDKSNAMELQVRAQTQDQDAPKPKDTDSTNLLGSSNP